MTETDTFIVRAEINSSLSALWFIAGLLMVSGLITVAVSGGTAASGAVLGAGLLALLLALTVQAIRYPRK